MNTGQMPEVLTLHIALSGWRTGGQPWSAVMEIPEDATLGELHHTIQKLVKFDDDHLFEFYAGRNWRQRKVEFGGPESPFDASEADDIKLANVFPLPKSCKLYYHFDFGDDWVFEIKSPIRRKPMNRRAKYPRFIEESGRRPRQYGGDRDEG
jgi:hypothetical protein